MYGGYGQHSSLASEMQAYANLHLTRSYEYLLSASYFNNYQTNRGGFSKLFKKLSDEAWEKSIELIKHITTRGELICLLYFFLLIGVYVIHTIPKG